MAESVTFDASAFETSLRAALNKIQINSDAEAEALAYTIANGAKQRAPVRTGRLRSSIGVQAGQDAAGKFFDVGAYAAYAARIEFGFMNMTDSLGRTFHQSPQPYLRPAILEAAAGWKPRIMP